MDGLKSIGIDLQRRLDNGRNASKVSSFNTTNIGGDITNRIFE